MTVDITRRSILKSGPGTLAAGALTAGALAAGSGTAVAAEKYPNHPINFIVPWGPGGGADLLARTAGKLMGHDLGVSVPVINVPGATGMVGMAKLLTSPADGYTMAVLIGDTYALLARPHPAFDPKAVIPLAIMIQQASGYWVSTKSPWKTWPEFVAAAKKKPMKVAVLGYGSADDITTSYMKTKGLKLVEIPYSKPVLRYTSVIGGHTDLLYEQTGDVRAYFDGGEIRPLILFYPHRLTIPQFKNVPIGKEFGYTVDLPQFRSVAIRADTPPARVKVLADELARVAKTPDWKSYLEGQYADPNSYIPMDGARAFMNDWLAEAKKFRALTKMGGR
ncbi:MAG: Bug family tripartite tricarboxylate transporter substrate binding protein [Acetobacteraceae bacterium]